jgi:hypothetical protein
VARPFIRGLEDTRVRSDGATARQLSPRGVREREREAMVSGVPSMETGSSEVAAVLSSTGMAIGCRREELEGGSIAVEDGAAGGAYYRFGGREGWQCTEREWSTAVGAIDCWSFRP